MLESLEITGPEPQQKTRLRILETHFKYPFIRTEEVIDTETGTVVTRTEMVADHLLVTLHQGEDPSSFLKALDIPGSSLIPITSNLYRLTLPSHSLEALPQALEKFHTQKNNTQSIVEPDFIAHSSLTQALHIPSTATCSKSIDTVLNLESSFNAGDSNAIPNDPSFCYQWGIFPKINRGAFLTSIYQKNSSNIDALGAWKIRTDASSVVVAVLDSGIRYTHEDLAANMWHDPLPPNEDFYTSNTYGNNNDAMDDNGHGTHCAGIIGAVGNNGIGITGIAWNVQLMPCKCLDQNGSGAASDIILSVEYAMAHGATIFNCSWGVPSYSDALLAALMRARTKGIILVVAAGNEGVDNDEAPSYPASYELDNIVTVAATTQEDHLACFSNYGANTVSIAAPGSGIYSTFATSDSSYATESGTSMAAPYVTGSFALLKAQFPQKSYTELITRLLKSADKVPALQGKTIAGRLNIRRALAEE